MIITFCGHKNFPKNKEYEEKIINFLVSKAADRDVDLYLGEYGGFDEFAYKCCKKYKNINPKATLVFITPYLTIEYQKNHLNYQQSRFDQIIYPEIENKPLKYAIVYRNKWMVEKADYIICGIFNDWGALTRHISMQSV